MKLKIKRHSRSVLCVILTISLLISTMMVGLIATDAAKVTDTSDQSETVTVAEDVSNTSDESEASLSADNPSQLSAINQRSKSVEPVGASYDDDSVGWDGNARLLTKKNNYTDNSDGYTVTISNNTAEFTVDLSEETIENGNWWFKIKANTSTFCNGETVTTNTTYLAKNSNNGANAAKIDVANNNLTNHKIKLNVTFRDNDAAVSYTDMGEITHSIQVAGDFNNWQNSSDKLENVTASSASISINITEGEYEFKMIEDEVWYGNGTHSDGGQRIIDTCDGWTFHSGNTYKNVKLIASGGTYTFTWVFATNKLTVTYQNNETITTSLTLSMAPLILSSENESSTATVQAGELRDNNVSYKLYDDEGTLVATRFVTDGTRTVTFNVTPNVPSRSYHATIEPTASSEYTIVTSNSVTVTSTAYHEPAYRLIGRIIDGTDTNKWKYNAGLDVKTRVSGKVFSYFYDPSKHGAKPEFRIASSGKEYTGSTTDYGQSYLTVPTSEASGDTSRVYSTGDTYFKLPDNYNCYTIYIDQSGETPQIWCEKSNSKNVQVVAKDCSVRERGSGTGPHYTMCNSSGVTYADTVLTGVDCEITKTDLKAYIRNESSAVKDNCGEIATVYTGKTIRVTTTITNSDFKSNYYVVGFCFNGETNEILTPNSTGVYTTTYTLPEDMEKDYLEITPIYFLKDSSKAVTFYVEGFDEQVQSSWGNTIAVYPYYANKSANENAFGGYPGQPMVNYGGRYYSQIPKTHNGSTVQGITLSNYYWDDVHSNRSTGTTVHFGEVTSHRQTYDYDDFYWIYNQKSPTSIIFSFKYRTKLDNGSPTPGSSITIDNYNSTNGNGWDDLTDYYGRKVDLFGTRLTDNPSGTLYVVSDGYDQNYTGHYATEWNVYNANGTRIAQIDPSALIMNDVSGLSTTNIPDTRDAEEKTAGKKYVTWANEYINAYNTLKNSYTNYEVKISYEKELLNNESYRKSKVLGYGDEASRSDGRWYFTQENDTVTADIKIEYNDTYYTGGTTFTEEESYTTGTGNEQNKGSHTECSAYFTNITANREGNVYTYKRESGTILHSTTNHFTFTAEANNDNYEFLGWFLLREGKYTQITKKNVLDGESAMSSNATFVARFVKASGESLRVSHSVETNSSHTGSGTAYLSVYVFHSAEDATSYFSGGSVNPVFIKEDFTTTISVPQSSLQDASDYVYIRLRTIPGSSSVFNDFTGGNSDYSNTYISSRTSTNSNVHILDSSSYYTDIGFSVADITQASGDSLALLINALSYKSHLDRFGYSIQYNYKSRKLIKAGKLSNSDEDRLWGSQSYKSVASFTDADAEKYLNVSIGSDPSFKSDALKAEFVAEHSPYEENFKENTTWNFGAATITYNPDTLTFTGSLDASYSGDTSVYVTFDLPFAYAINMNASKVEDKFIIEKTGDYVVYNDNAEQADSIAVDFLDWFSFNDVKNESQLTEENRPALLTVPDVLYNDATNPTQKKVFQHWDFITEVEVGTGDNKVETVYQKCYSSTLNQAIYQDTILRPVYSDWIAKNAEEEKEDPSKTKSATITFLQNSRSQWNYDGCGTANTTWPTMHKFADRIFADFVLSFQYDNKKLNSLNQNTYKTGIILQPIANAEHKSAAQLADEYKNSKGLDEATAAIKLYNTDHATSDPTDYLLSYCSVKELDNRNGIEYYYGIANVNQTVNSNSDTYTEETVRRNYGYRAYSFIKKGTGVSAEVTISEPVYFTIYDIATIANGSSQH